MKPIVVAAVAAVIMAVLGTLYEQDGWLQLSSNTRLVLKGTTTLIAALLAAYGAWLDGGAPAWIICAGLVVCAVADVLLERSFFAGMACFAVGHALYITAFLMMKRIQPLNIVVFAALLVAMYKMRAKLLPSFPYVLYGTVISAMAALSISQAPVAAVGAFLFLTSDIVLAYRLAGMAPASWSKVILLFYYGGQYLLGLSTLFR